MSKRRHLGTVVVSLFFVLDFGVGYFIGRRENRPPGSTGDTTNSSVSDSMIRSRTDAQALRTYNGVERKKLTFDEIDPRRQSVLNEREASGGRRAKEQIDQDGYEQMFVYAGLTSQQIDAILPKLLQSIKMSMISEQSILDTLFAREEFNKVLQGTLSPEQLKAYNDFEYLKPAIRESKSLEEFANAEGLSIARETIDIITRGIAAAESFSAAPCHGPKDSLAIPKVGQDDIAAYLSQNIDRLKSASDSAIQALSPQISPDELALVQRFYDYQLQRGRDELVRVSRPEHERIADLMRRGEEQRIEEIQAP